MDPNHKTPEGDTYEVDGRKYVMCRTTGGAKAYDVTAGEYAKHDPTWRSYVKGSGDYDKPVMSEHTAIPASTAKLPLTYVKRTNIKYLDSIATDGFAATKERVAMWGYSAGTQYVSRDLFILGIWMGKDAGPGESMQPAGGEVYANLIVKVDVPFRDVYLRDSLAVLNGDNTSLGNTVLSFAPIPPTNIYLEITKEVADAVNAKTKMAKQGVGTFSLKDLWKNLKLIVEVIPTVVKPTEDEW